MPTPSMEWTALLMTRERHGFSTEISRAIAAVESVLPRLTDADLAAPYPDVLGGIRPATGLFLMHLTAHLSFHFGQAGYLRRALTADGRTSGAISMQSLAGRPI